MKRIIISPVILAGMRRRLRTAQSPFRQQSCDFASAPGSTSIRTETVDVEQVLVLTALCTNVYHGQCGSARGDLDPTGWNVM